MNCRYSHCKDRTRTHVDVGLHLDVLSARHRIDFGLLKSGRRTLLCLLPSACLTLPLYLHWVLLLRGLCCPRGEMGRCEMANHKHMRGVKDGRTGIGTIGAGRGCVDLKEPWMHRCFFSSTHPDRCGVCERRPPHDPRVVHDVAWLHLNAVTREGRVQQSCQCVEEELLLCM